MKFFLIAAISSTMSLSSKPALADTQLGNGGDAVVCRNEDGQITRVALLDFWENEALGRSFNVDLGDEQLTPVEKVHLALDRIAIFDIFRANDYRKQLNVFLANVTWTRAPLAGVNDEELPVVPECPIEQLAVQREPQTPMDGRYFISAELWSHLSPDEQAGLILHEIIYNEAKALGHSTSYKVRFFNMMLLSSGISPEFYSNATIRLGFLHFVGYGRSPVTQRLWSIANGTCDSPVMIAGGREASAEEFDNDSPLPEAVLMRALSREYTGGKMGWITASESTPSGRRERFYRVDAKCSQGICKKFSVQKLPFGMGDEARKICLYP